MGNTAALRSLLGKVSSEEACRLILDSANMSAVSREESTGTDDVGGGLFREPHFVMSPLFLAAFRGHSSSVEVGVLSSMLLLLLFYTLIA